MSLLDSISVSFHDDTVLYFADRGDNHIVVIVRTDIIRVIVLGLQLQSDLVSSIEVHSILMHPSIGDIFNRRRRPRCTLCLRREQVATP